MNESFAVRGAIYSNNAATKEIDPKSFKLTHLSAAYWQADENNASMQRIYGASFETADELKAWEHMMEEAKKRDHRKLGKELELFVMSEKVGPGLPLLSPKGEIIRHELEKLSREKHLEWGYNSVRPRRGQRRVACYPPRECFRRS